MIFAGFKSPSFFINRVTTPSIGNEDNRKDKHFTNF